MLVKIVDGQPVEYSLAQLKSDNPRTSFPKEPDFDLLASYEVYAVVETAPPSIDVSAQELIKGFALVDGNWQQTWQVNNLPPTAALVQRERKRRLEAGFDYDFGDGRGVHRIGTTRADMVGWRDVIDYANALIDTGDTTTIINIVTDTGPTTLTAPEWQAIMLHAATIRQTLWAKSFTLQASNPIPENYADDSHWT